MIKAIIFDLDGVLVDARELHYEALNRALGKWGYQGVVVVCPGVCIGYYGSGDN